MPRAYVSKLTVLFVVVDDTGKVIFATYAGKNYRGAFKVDC